MASGSFENTDIRGGTFGAPKTGVVRQTEGGPAPVGWLTPPPGYVLIQTINGRLGVLLLMGDGSPTIVSGYATWQTVERPRRVSLTEWAGREPTRITFPIFLDGRQMAGSWGAKGVRAVTSTIRELEKMAGLTASGTPARLIFETGGKVEHDYSNAPHLRWVIETLEWGEAVRNRNGGKVRQFADITLMQYVDSDLAALPGLESSRFTPSRDKNRTTTVTSKEGDTLRKICARHRMTHAELQATKKLNKIRDADKVLEKGTKIKLQAQGVKLGPDPRSGTFGG